MPEIFTSTEQEVKAYYNHRGYSALYPSDVSKMSEDRLSTTARQMVEITDGIFKRNVQLTEERTLQLCADIRHESVLPFILINEETDKVVGSTLYTRVSSPFPDSSVTSYELGGSTKGRALRAPMSMLFAGQVNWAFEQLRESTNHIVMHTRIATRQTSEAYNGNVLGQALMVATPMFGDFSHYVGPRTAEPFITSAMQLDQASWDALIPESPLYLPDEHGAHSIRQLFIESKHTAVEPDIRIAERSHSGGELPEFYQINGPDAKNATNATSEAVYLFSDHPVSLDAYYARFDCCASPGLSDRVIVETDVAGNRIMVQKVFCWLQEKGFRLSGIAPSYLEFGRLALIFGRPGSVPTGDNIATADLSALGNAYTTQRFFTLVLQEQQPRKQ